MGINMGNHSTWARICPGRTGEIFVSSVFCKGIFLSMTTSATTTTTTACSGGIQHGTYITTFGIYGRGWIGGKGRIYRGRDEEAGGDKNKK
jgi:hypothetical protein